MPIIAEIAEKVGSSKEFGTPTYEEILDRMGLVGMEIVVEKDLLESLKSGTRMSRSVLAELLAFNAIGVDGEAFPNINTAGLDPALVNYLKLFSSNGSVDMDWLDSFGLDSLFNNLRRLDIDSRQYPEDGLELTTVKLFVKKVVRDGVTDVLRSEEHDISDLSSLINFDGANVLIDINCFSEKLPYERALKWMKDSIDFNAGVFQKLLKYRLSSLEGGKEFLANVPESKIIDAYTDAYKRGVLKWAWNIVMKDDFPICDSYESALEQMIQVVDADPKLDKAEIFRLMKTFINRKIGIHGRKMVDSINVPVFIDKEEEGALD